MPEEIVNRLAVTAIVASTPTKVTSMESHKPHNQEDNSAPPPSYEEEHITELPEGLYIFANKTGEMVLDLPESGWFSLLFRPESVGLGEQTPIQLFHRRNQLWIVKRDGSGGAFTVQNLLWGSFLSAPVKVYETYLVLFRKEVGSPVVKGNRRSLNARLRSHQEWRIGKTSAELFTVHCEHNNTFLDIVGLGQLHAVLGSVRIPGREEQLWELERVSRTGQEIRKILSDWKPDLASRIFEPYPDDAQYFVLPYELRKSLLDRAGISRQGYIKYAFDYHDLVIKAKDSISSWARGRFAASGYSLLFGVIYGEAERGPKAYNWYLASDMRSLAFLDAQTGKEYTTAALDEFSFQPVFATF
ncbi:hypothetical protein FRC04_004673 [Tulasnella sp. 424]|nr:hypothetical protein FRC04_004673 [Tulasnella sp. 424]